MPANRKSKAIESYLSKAQKPFDAEQLASGILKGNRAALAKGITLLESRNQEHREIANKLLKQCLPHAGNSYRIGITGVPGVGKSTFIEALGQLVVSKGHKLAVLAIDPSSSRNKGSILADKTRMTGLVNNQNAFIRPSPSSGTLGGVANATRESIVLCEAAGYDIIFVETVGVGQSEYMVHEMVDFFLLLMLPGAGDELQGIKRGIMEMADAVIINKADGNNAAKAKLAAAGYRNALHLFPPQENGWIPEVLTCSALQKQGMEDIWQMLITYRERMLASGHLETKRAQQLKNWFHEMLDNTLRDRFFAQKGIGPLIEDMFRKVSEGRLAPLEAAAAIVNKFFKP